MRYLASILTLPLLLAGLIVYAQKDTTPSNFQPEIVIDRGVTKINKKVLEYENEFEKHRTACREEYIEHFTRDINYSIDRAKDSSQIREYVKRKEYLIQHSKTTCRYLVNNRSHFKSRDGKLRIYFNWAGGCYYLTTFIINDEIVKIEYEYNQTYFDFYFKNDKLILFADIEKRSRCCKIDCDYTAKYYFKRKKIIHSETTGTISGRRKKPNGEIHDYCRFNDEGTILPLAQKLIKEKQEWYLNTKD